MDDESNDDSVDVDTSSIVREYQWYKPAKSLRANILTYLCQHQKS